jgi:hypothetical protein
MGDPVTVAEGCIGTDSIEVWHMIAVADDGAGADAEDPSFHCQESVIGTDAIEIIVATQIDVDDDLVGADAVQVTGSVDLSDSGTGVDAVGKLKGTKQYPYVPKDHSA